MVKQQQSTLCLLTLLFVFVSSPLSNVNADKDFMKKNADSEEVLDSNPMSSNLSDYQTSLESHEAMQQQSIGGVPQMGMEVSADRQTPNSGTFQGGKLIIHEEEPTVEEEEEVVAPTQAMRRIQRHSTVSKEPDPSASESLLELLVTIAGQPERWNQLIRYINTILKSPIVISPELEQQLKLKQHNSENPKVEKKQDNNTIQHMIIYLKNEKGNSYQQHHQKGTTTMKPWPVFNEERTTSSIADDFRYDETTNTEDEQRFINELHNLDIQNEQQEQQEEQLKTTRKPPAPKEWFSFRRVTSVPSSSAGYDKTRARNAYIAVSVIAPTMRKFYRTQTKEKSADELENELVHLKPWSHRDNLKQMEHLREKWRPLLTEAEDDAETDARNLVEK